MLAKSRQLRGLPAHDPNEAALIAASWRDAMSDVPLECLDEVFRRAIQNYQNIEIPFGVPQLRAAWQEVRGEMDNEIKHVETQEFLAELKAMAECAHRYEERAPDPEEAAIFESVKVCVKCDHAIPKFRKSDKAQRAAAYLQIARRA